mmetsp:Transcript_101677/g.328096  ORF Transcript_101677/g.328096 Transcript_101677/m.328096 type:complete len:179 (-) Transcript_101677:148-684(-)
MPSLYTCALRLLAAAFMFANCGAAALLKAVPGITQRAVPRPAAAVGDAAPGVVDNAHLPLGIGLELIDSLPALQLKCENVTQGLAASPCWSSSKARAADSAAPLGQGSAVSAAKALPVCDAFGEFARSTCVASCLQWAWISRSMWLCIMALFTFIACRMSGSFEKNLMTANNILHQVL